MAKGDVGSQGYMNEALRALPSAQASVGGFAPSMGPSYPDMLIQMAMRNQFGLMNPQQQQPMQQGQPQLFGRNVTSQGLKRQNTPTRSMSKINSGPKNLMKSAM